MSTIVQEELNAIFNLNRYRVQRMCDEIIARELTADGREKNKEIMTVVCHCEKNIIKASEQQVM